MPFRNQKLSESDYEISSQWILNISVPLADVIRKISVNLCHLLMKIRWNENS